MNVWVIEVRSPGGWLPTLTVSLRPAVYFSRADARRDIYNLEIPVLARVCRVSKYVPADGGR
jgi:hypothetical protein